jgi:hypothetical protein
MSTVTVLSGPERRRRWTSTEKARIVEESSARAGKSGATFCFHGLGPGHGKATLPSYAAIFLCCHLRRCVDCMTQSECAIVQRPMHLLFPASAPHARRTSGLRPAGCAILPIDRGARYRPTFATGLTADQPEEPQTEAAPREPKCPRQRPLGPFTRWDRFCVHHPLDEGRPQWRHCAND